MAGFGALVLLIGLAGLAQPDGRLAGLVFGLVGVGTIVRGLRSSSVTVTDDAVVDPIDGPHPAIRLH
jgi:hypothetical protein